MSKIQFKLYLTYCKIRRVINAIIIIVLNYIYTTILTPWVTAMAIAIWNEYLNSQYFKIRKETGGEKFAKEWFFNDPIHIYEEHRQNVFKNKKLLLKIIFLPHTVQYEKYPLTSRIYTAKDLW